MKYCPYCGEELWDENASFCAECGKHIPERGPRGPQKESESAPVVSENPQTEADAEPYGEEDRPEDDHHDPGDGYDGYYDDVLPDDHGNIRSAVDKQLIKKVAVLGISVILIICACVAIMYIL